MYKVTFRNPKELLASMFNQEFKSRKEVKNFIQLDAEHYAAVHHFSEDAELVNEDPDYQDYFILYRRCGVTKKAELVYQYFKC